MTVTYHSIRPVFKRQLEQVQPLVSELALDIVDAQISLNKIVANTKALHSGPKMRIEHSRGRNIHLVRHMGVSLKLRRVDYYLYQLQQGLRLLIELLVAQFMLRRNRYPALPFS
jgi:hypothetical protein